MTLATTLTLKTDSSRRDQTVELVQITDLHLLADPQGLLLGVSTDDTAREVFKFAQSKDWPPDLVLLTGDLAQEPLPETYRRLNELLRSLKTPCVCLPGNHDDPSTMSEQLRGDNVRCLSRVLTDHWQIICLNTSLPEKEGGHVSEESLSQLETLLDEQPDRFALVGLHHPPVSVGCSWLDTMIVDNGDKLLELVRSRPQSRAIVCGHIHQALHLRDRGLEIFGTPSTCFQFMPDSEKFTLDELGPGYRRLSLFPDGRIESEVYRLPGKPRGLDQSAAGY
jgi:Icc protein